MAPNRELKVFEPRPNSGMLVCPMKIAPASRRREVRSSSSFSMFFAKGANPLVVGNPLTATASFGAIGIPCKGPRSEMGT